MRDAPTPEALGPTPSPSPEAARPIDRERSTDRTSHVSPARYRYPMHTVRWHLPLGAITSARPELDHHQAHDRAVSAAHRWLAWIAEDPDAEQLAPVADLADDTDDTASWIDADPGTPPAAAARAWEWATTVLSCATTRDD